VWAFGSGQCLVWASQPLPLASTLSRCSELSRCS
jgi:hypothetical protein